MTTAVVFVPVEDFTEFAAQCLEYCRTCGYQVRGLVRGDWRAVLALLGAGQADLAVVAQVAHAWMPGAPRIEVATPAGGRDAQTGRRPTNTRTVPVPAVPRPVANAATGRGMTTVDLMRRANRQTRRPR